jgi:predicted HTH transcriptional regulator
MGIFQIDRNDGRKEKLTLAGLLFLGKFEAITQKIPHFHLEYINKRGIATGRWKDRVSTGDLNYPDLNVFDFYQIVLAKLLETIEDSFELDKNSVRKSNLELSTALREALGNVLIHADYQDPETTIKITVDSLYYSFLNPGSMKVSQYQFFTGGVSIPRNNTLITFFRRIGASERSGTGGPDIYKFAAINKYRLPELTTNFKSTEIKIWVAAPADSHSDFSDKEKKIFEYLIKVTEAKISDIQKNTGFTKYSIHKTLKALMEKKVVGTYGNGPATKYFRKPSAVEKVSMMNVLQDFIKSQD